MRYGNLSIKWNDMTFNLIKKRKVILFYIFLLSVCIGIFLRIRYLGTNDLWLDELASIDYANVKNVFDIFHKLNTFADPNPPMYFLLLHYWLKVFGFTIVSARLLSAIFSIATIAIIYRLTLLISENKELALLSASFFSLCYGSVYYATAARPYAMLIFFGALFLLTRIKARYKEKRYIYTLHLLSSVCLASIELFGTLFVLCSIIEQTILFLRRKKTPLFSSQNFLHSIICELIGIFICIIYILINFKLYNSISHGNHYAPYIDLMFITSTFSEFFSFKAFIVIMLMVFSSYIVFMKYKEFPEKLKKNDILQIFIDAGGYILILVLLIGYLIGISTPILSERHLLVLLPTVIIFVSIYIYPLLINTNTSIVFLILFSFFLYSSASFCLQILESPYRQSFNYRILGPLLEKYPLVFTTTPKEYIQTYIKLTGIPSKYENKIHLFSNIEKYDPKNVNHIAIYFSFDLSKTLFFGLMALKKEGYSCKAIQDFGQVKLNDEFRYLLLVARCDKIQPTQSISSKID